MKKIFSHLCFSLFTFLFFVSQCEAVASFVSSADSLESALSKSKSDTAKLNLLNDLTWQYLYSDIDKAEKYGHEALRLSLMLDIPKEIASAHHTLATVFLQLNKNDSALLHFKQAIKIYSENHIEGKAAGSYNGMGNVYLYEGIFEKALENYLESLRLLEKSNNKQKTGLVLSNIGIVYFNLENYDKATEYYNRALIIAQESADTSGMASCYSNLGNIYKELKNYSKAKEYLTVAIGFFKQMDETYGLANCFAGLGACSQQEKKYEEAMDYYDQAIAIYEKMKNDDGIATINFDYGGIYTDLKQYDKAIFYLNKSMEAARKIKALNRVMEAYSVLHEVYAKKNEFKKSYDALMLYMQVKDSVLNETNHKNIAKMQTIYETEKKEQQLVAQESELKKNQAELKQKTIQRNAILFGCILTLLLMIVVYNGYREKKKANISITHQKEIIEQKNKDITDSINYAKRIQTAILPSAQFIRKLFPESFVYYHPRDIVSGDFYFFAEVGNLKIAAACDCTGHGIPGALMSMIGNDMLNKIVNEMKITGTDQILNELHKNIISVLNPEKGIRTSSDGMDIGIICYNTEQKLVQYSGAVRPMYFFDSSGLHEVKGNRYSIAGVAEDTFSFSSQTISISGRTTFYLFSDGFADQFGGNDGKKFMSKRFKELLSSVQNKNMEEQRNILDETLLTWKREREQVDDVLVIGIRL